MTVISCNVVHPTLDVRDLRIALAGRAELVKGVSFKVMPRQVVALVGESGSGKTLIGRSILKLLPEGIAPTGGDILYHGQSTLEMTERRMRGLRGGRIGMVFQEPLVSLNPAMRIGQQMAEGLRLHKRLTRAEIRERSIAILRRIRIDDPKACLDAYPHEFSGGMRQRIMLASVMLIEPDLLIADEPTTALDNLAQKEVLETMIDLTREVGTSVLLITHNLGLVQKYADRVVVLRSGEKVEEGDVNDIIASPKHEYTRRLVESVPRIAAGRNKTPSKLPLIQAEQISLSYIRRSGLVLGSEKKKVLRQVSLTIHRGEIVGLVGGSGSGKTSLGRALLRLIDIDGGRISYLGQDISRAPDSQLRSFRQKCQIVFQDPFSSLDPRMRVEAIVGEALRHDRSLDRPAKARRVEEALAAVQLPGFGDRFPHQLSGGQRQRVAIARAIVGQPDFVVADEPIAALDMTVQKQILELFSDLQAQRGFACLFISHDLASVQQIAHRIVVMNEGAIVEEGACDAVFASPQHEYTKNLIAASPLLAKNTHDDQFKVVE